MEKQKYKKMGLRDTGKQRAAEEMGVEHVLAHTFWGIAVLRGEFSGVGKSFNVSASSAKSGVMLCFLYKLLQ